MGASVRVRLTGEGRPILMLHGNPDTAEMWDPAARRLGSRRRCVAPDLPGFGKSTVPPGFDFSLDAMAEWVDAVADAAGLSEAVDLAVHDFGGPFGLAWAVRHPERVRRIIVSNTIFFADYRWHAWARAWRTPVAGELAMLMMSRLLFTRELARGGPGLPPGHAEAAWRRLTWRARWTVLRLYRATDPEHFAGWEPEMRELMDIRPGLVLWGDRDPYIPGRFADRFGEARVQHFPGAGHWLPVEATEQWVEAAGAFLDAEEPQSSAAP